jgi:hypothetical protein
MICQIHCSLYVDHLNVHHDHEYLFIPFPHVPLPFYLVLLHVCLIQSVCFLFQIVALDQFMAKPHHLGLLNDIHADLLISSLNTVFILYPYLSRKPVKIFIEANLSHDLPAAIQTKVMNYYTLGRDISFVKQHDSQGKLLPGVLTRHKANLVSYFKTALDNDKLYVARQLATVSKQVELKYQHARRVSDMRSGICMGLGLARIIPDLSDMEQTLKTFVEQATMFRCYQKGSAIIYSGKRGSGGNRRVDDLLMAVILAVAWARLPQNTYVLE